MASIYQFIIMGSQLDEMRKEQRPWIRVTFDSSPMEALGPVSGIVHLVNKGKTPAKAISADFVMQRIKNGEEPTFDYSVPHVNYSTGVLFPDESGDAHPSRLRKSSSCDSAEPETLTKSEFDDLKGTRVFFVVYGMIHYNDFFGVDHWTKFCGFAAISSTTSSTVTAKGCTDYNDVDSN